MRNYILVLLASMTILYGCSKSSTPANGNSAIIPASAVPAAVLSSFNIGFPGASEIEWIREGNDFVSQFNLDDERHESKFDDSGHESEHHLLCTSGAVPAAVLDSFRAAFASDIVYEWKLTAEGTWKAHFMRDTIKWEVTLTAAGSIIKTEHD